MNPEHSHSWSIELHFTLTHTAKKPLLISNSTAINFQRDFIPVQSAWITLLLLEGLQVRSRLGVISTLKNHAFIDIRVYCHLPPPSPFMSGQFAEIKLLLFEGLISDRMNIHQRRDSERRRRRPLI